MLKLLNSRPCQTFFNNISVKYLLLLICLLGFPTSTFAAQKVDVLELRYFPHRNGLLDHPDVEILDELQNAKVGDVVNKVNVMSDQFETAIEKGTTYLGYKSTSNTNAIDWNVIHERSFYTSFPTVPYSKIVGGNTETGLKVDYRTMLTEIDICSYVNNGLDYVVVWGFGSNIVTPESVMFGKYGNISNSLTGMFDLPLCNRSYAVLHLNYGRGVTEAVHSFGHHIEGVLYYADKNLYNLFLGATTGAPVRRCGNVHYPTNGRGDYDYFNSEYMITDCEDWAPDSIGETRSQNCLRWSVTGKNSAGESYDECYNDDRFLDGHLGWLIYWMQNIPGPENTKVYQGQKLKNWWDFVVDFDAAMNEGRSLVLPTASYAVDIDQVPDQLTFSGQKHTTIVHLNDIQTKYLDLRLSANIDSERQKVEIYPIGDLNMDRVMDAKDYRIFDLRNFSGGQLNVRQQRLADFNHDGLVNKADEDVLTGIRFFKKPITGDYVLFFDAVPVNQVTKYSIEVYVKHKFGGEVLGRQSFSVIVNKDSIPTNDNPISTLPNVFLYDIPNSNLTSEHDLAHGRGVVIKGKNSFLVGEETNIQVEIKNNGKKTSPQAKVLFEVKNGDTGEVVHSSTSSISSLRSRQGRYLSFTWTPLKDGKYYYDATIDPLNELDEFNEDNNYARLAVNISSTGGGAFSIDKPFMEKWLYGKKESIRLNAYGKLKGNIKSRFYLVSEDRTKVYGPFKNTSRSSETINFVPESYVSAGNYKVVLISCYLEDCSKDYGLNTFNIGFVDIDGNARVLGDSDGMDEDEVEIEDEIELEDESAKDDYVANEASMVRKVDDKLVNRLKGRILLQVEKRGQAWYVDPVTGDRFYLKDGGAAYTMFHRAGLGITNRDLSRIPVGLTEGTDEAKDTDGDGLSDLLEVAVGTNPEEADSDEDGFDDATEVRQMYNPRGKDKQSTDNALINRLRGRILLQVEDKGQAWYLSPVDGKRYLLSDGEQAYIILRKLSLGVKDADLQKISVGVME